MCLFAYLIPTWVSSKVYNRQSLKLVRTLWGHDDHVWSIDMNRLETLPKAQKGPCCKKNWTGDNGHTSKMTNYEKSWLNSLLDIFCIQLDHNASISQDGASITAQTYYKRYHLSGKIIYRMINKRCSSSNKSYFQKIKKHFLQCKLSCEMLIVLCVTQITGGGGDSGACG